jgi:hypothetical protein
MKNLHVLPTDKPSRLSILNSGKLNFGAEIMSSSNSKPQNLYITSDEKPKAGDWSLYQNKIHKCIEDIVGDEFKKIILTTDQDLIDNGVQDIDTEFLEWFVNNPSCEYVTVYDGLFENRIWKKYIIIPKEEPKQETTLEEAAIKYATNHGMMSYVFPEKEKSFIDGAKWQAERMYSEEEVNEIISEAWNSCEDNEGETFTEARKRILEQFKKK